MKLSIFCLFGSKTPIHAQKIVLWGGGNFTPKMKLSKGTPLRESLSVKIRQRLWPLEVSTKKVYIEINKKIIIFIRAYTSPISAEALRGRICTKFDKAYRSHRPNHP